MCFLSLCNNNRSDIHYSVEGVDDDDDVDDPDAANQEKAPIFAPRDRGVAATTAAARSNGGLEKAAEVAGGSENR